MAALGHAWRVLQWLPYGLLRFTRGGYERAAEHFDERHDTPPLDQIDMHGKHVLITGANSGIGYAAALRLAHMGAHVHLLCRNRQRGEAAIASIHESLSNATSPSTSTTTLATSPTTSATSSATSPSTSPSTSSATSPSTAATTTSTDTTSTSPSSCTLHVVKLGSLPEVRAFAAHYRQSGLPLHVLIHNAGCMQPRTLSQDGIETNLQVNLIAPFLLTELLIPVLERTDDARVIMVSSGGMLTERLLVNDLQWEQAGFDATRQYARNKRQQVALTERWSELHDGILFVSMHPGWVDTAAVRDSMPDFHRHMQSRLRDADQGADTVVWLSAVPRQLLQPAGFYLDRALASKHLFMADTTHSPPLVDRLWSECVRLSGAGDGEDEIE